MNKILLQCDNLSKRYQEGTVQTDVLHNVSFSVGEGEMMAIVGSSGSGKSTLLHLLGGLDTPTNGDVIFSGQPMSKMSSAAKAELRNRELGLYLPIPPPAAGFHGAGKRGDAAADWQKETGRDLTPAPATCLEKR